MTPERRSQLKGGEAGGEAYRALVRQLGTDGKLGTGWPKEWGGQGRTPLEQYLFYDEANRAGVPLPLVTLNTVGPTLMLYGSDEQKEHFLPQILAGRAALRHRLQRAGRRHRPRVGEHPRRPRRRRVRDQRPEGLHHRRPRRRLDLARLPHRSRREEAQGHLDHPRAHRRRRVQAHADLGARRRAHERDVLRGRARPGHQRRARGERGLEAHHEPAQPRARRAGPGRQARSPLRRGPRLGAGDAPRRRHASRSTRSGCSRRSVGCTRSSRRRSS